MSTAKALILVVVGSSLTLTQSTIAQQSNTTQAATTAGTETSACVLPAQILSHSDYDGRFRKAAAFLTHKIEVKTVHKPYPGKGPPICGLGARAKAVTFVRESSEPLTLVTAGFYAGWAQADKSDPAFGQGAAGYGWRLGATLADGAAGGFFGTFLYPSLFREDPRYYRQLNGSAKTRMRHGLLHVFVARADSGRLMFNYSEWLTVASTSALQNFYHPGNRRGFDPAAARAGAALGTDMGSDVLREFWPGIARKFKLPFLRRGATATGTPANPLH